MVHVGSMGDMDAYVEGRLTWQTVPQPGTRHKAAGMEQGLCPPVW